MEQKTRAFVTLLSKITSPKKKLFLRTAQECRTQILLARIGNNFKFYLPVVFTL
jgi:hypothetical protein